MMISVKEGLPHSDIRGSTIARISPRLFAACHVLHRLLAPRHPPNALVSLTIQPPIARTQYQTAHKHLRAEQQALRLPTTLPFPDSPVKDLPWREQASAEGGVSWKRPSWEPEVPAEASPMSNCPEAALQDIERGERSQMIWQVVI